MCCPYLFCTRFSPCQVLCMTAFNSNNNETKGNCSVYSHQGGMDFWDSWILFGGGFVSGGFCFSWCLGFVMILVFKLHPLYTDGISD